MMGVVNPFSVLFLRQQRVGLQILHRDVARPDGESDGHQLYRTFA